MSELTVSPVIDVTELEAAYAAPAFAPAVLDEVVTTQDEVDWAIAGVVAAVLGIAVAVVLYICSVCEARSFNACITAVRRYFGKGC